MYKYAKGTDVVIIGCPVYGGMAGIIAAQDAAPQSAELRYTVRLSAGALVSVPESKLKLLQIDTTEEETNNQQTMFRA